MSLFFWVVHKETCRRELISLHSHVQKLVCKQVKHQHVLRKSLISSLGLRIAAMLLDCLSSSPWCLGARGVFVRLWCPVECQCCTVSGHCTVRDPSILFFLLLFGERRSKIVKAFSRRICMCCELRGNYYHSCIQLEASGRSTNAVCTVSCIFVCSRNS